MTQRIECRDGSRRDHAVATALAALRRGDLVVLPTESVYAVAADAFSSRGVGALREAKEYSTSTPLPVMVGRRATVPGIAARISHEANHLMEAFWPGPLTLLLTPQPSLAWDQPADAPLAVRMPVHPLALALLVASGPLVVTTANIAGMSAPTTVDDALLQLGDGVAIALDAGPLSMANPLPSTIIDARSDPPRVMRAGAIPEQDLARVCPSVTGPDASSTP